MSGGVGGEVGEDPLESHDLVDVVDIACFVSRPACPSAKEPHLHIRSSHEAAAAIDAIRVDAAAIGAAALLAVALFGDGR